MAEINNEYTYIVSTDCQVRIHEGKVVTMKGDDLRKFNEDTFELDNRMHLVSFETTRTPKTYLNYFEFFSRISDRESSRPEIQGRYMSMLDMGYIPIIAPPSFMSEEITSMFLPLLQRSGIDIREQRPMRIDGRGFDAKCNDIWGSRMDMAEFLGCSLTDVKPITFLLEVNRRCK